MLRKAVLGLCLVLSVCPTIPIAHAQAPQTEKVVRLGDRQEFWFEPGIAPC